MEKTLTISPADSTVKVDLMGLSLFVSSKLGVTQANTQKQILTVRAEEELINAFIEKEREAAQGLLKFEIK